MTSAGASPDDVEEGVDSSHSISLLLVERAIFDAPLKTMKGAVKIKHTLWCTTKL